MGALWAEESASAKSPGSVSRKLSLRGGIMWQEHRQQRAGTRRRAERSAVGSWGHSRDLDFIPNRKPLESFC